MRTRTRFTIADFFTVIRLPLAVAFGIKIDQVAQRNVALQLRQGKRGRVGRRSDFGAGLNERGFRQVLEVARKAGRTGQADLLVQQGKDAFGHAFGRTMLLGSLVIFSPPRPKMWDTLNLRFGSTFTFSL